MPWAMRKERKEAERQEEAMQSRPSPAPAMPHHPTDAAPTSPTATRHSGPHRLPAGRPYSPVAMGKSIRLFQPAQMMGYKRSQRHSINHTALLRIKGVRDTKDAKFYCGKRVAYVFKGKKAKAQIRSGQNAKLKSRVRVVWGRVTRAHGNSGVVRAKFAPNLPCQSIGKKLRVYLYPSRI
eukprot:gene26352-65552_t